MNKPLDIRRRRSAGIRALALALALACVPLNQVRATDLTLGCSAEEKASKQCTRDKDFDKLTRATLPAFTQKQLDTAQGALASYLTRIQNLPSDGAGFFQDDWEAQVRSCVDTGLDKGFSGCIESIDMDGKAKQALKAWSSSLHRYSTALLIGQRNGVAAGSSYDNLVKTIVPSMKSQIASATSRIVQSGGQSGGAGPNASPPPAGGVAGGVAGGTKGGTVGGTLQGIGVGGPLGTGDDKPKPDQKLGKDPVKGDVGGDPNGRPNGTTPYGDNKDPSNSDPVKGWHLDSDLADPPPPPLACPLADDACPRGAGRGTPAVPKAMSDIVLSLKREGLIARGARYLAIQNVTAYIRAEYMVQTDPAAFNASIDSMTQACLKKATDRGVTAADGVDNGHDGALLKAVLGMADGAKAAFRGGKPSPAELQKQHREAAVSAADRLTFLVREMGALRKDFNKAPTELGKSWPGWLPGQTALKIINAGIPGFLEGYTGNDKRPCSVINTAMAGAPLVGKPIPDENYSEADKRLFEQGLLKAHDKPVATSYLQRCEVKASVMDRDASEMARLLGQFPELGEPVDQGLFVYENVSNQQLADRKMKSLDGAMAQLAGKQDLLGNEGALSRMRSAIADICANPEDAGKFALSDDQVMNGLMSCGDHAPLPANSTDPFAREKTGQDLSARANEECNSIRQDAAVVCLIRDEVKTTELKKFLFLGTVTTGLDVLGTVGMGGAALKGLAQGSLLADMAGSFAAGHAKGAAIGLSIGAGVGLYGISSSKSEAERATANYYAGLASVEAYQGAVEAASDAKKNFLGDLLLGTIVGHALGGGAGAAAEADRPILNDKLAKEYDSALRRAPGAERERALAAFQKNFREEFGKRTGLGDLSKFSNSDLLAVAEVERTSKLGPEAGALEAALKICAADKACQQKAIDNHVFKSSEALATADTAPAQPRGRAPLDGHSSIVDRSPGTASGLVADLKTKIPDYQKLTEAELAERIYNQEVAPPEPKITKADLADPAKLAKIKSESEAMAAKIGLKPQAGGAYNMPGPGGTFVNATYELKDSTGHEVPVTRVQYNDGHWWFTGEPLHPGQVNSKNPLYKVYVGVPADQLSGELGEMVGRARKNSVAGNATFKLAGSASDLSRPDRLCFYFEDAKDARRFAEDAEGYLKSKGYPPGTPAEAGRAGDHVAIGRDLPGMSSRDNATRALAAVMKTCAEADAVCRDKILAARGMRPDLMPLDMPSEVTPLAPTPPRGGPKDAELGTAEFAAKRGVSFDDEPSPPATVRAGKGAARIVSGEDATVRAGKSATPHPTGSSVGTVVPCCASVETGLPVPGVPKPGLTAETDLYFTGKGAQPSAPPPDGAYAMTMPKELKGRKVSVGEYVIPPGTTEERAAKVMPPGKTFENNATLAGKGAQTLGAYFVTSEPVPPELRAPEMTNQRKAWAAEHADSVIKVRTSNPWGKGMGVASQQLRRDLAVAGLADELSAHATYDGKPLLRTAKILSTDADHAMGIMRQEPVRGPTVFEIHTAMACVETPGACRPEDSAKIDSVLKDAGLTKDGQPDPAAMKEAENKIRALEQFYRDTHVDVINFEKTNGIIASDIPGPGTKARAGAVVETGFDYNHGRNVIWDAAAKSFVMIDW